MGKTINQSMRKLVKGYKETPSLLEMKAKGLLRNSLNAPQMVRQDFMNLFVALQEECLKASIVIGDDGYLVKA